MVQQRQERVEGWILRRKNKWLSEQPVQEWKLPLMVLAVSVMVFILLTSMFGVTVDTRTGAVNFQVEPGSDWSTPSPLPPEINPVVGKSGDTRFRANPMGQYPWFCFLAMILGYFIAVGLFIIGWLDYCKWKYVKAKEMEAKKNVT